MLIPLEFGNVPLNNHNWYKLIAFADAVRSRESDIFTHWDDSYKSFRAKALHSESLPRQPWKATNANRPDTSLNSFNAAGTLSYFSGAFYC